MKNKKFAPIVLFVYARPEHTKKTIESLSKNFYSKESDIFIFSDAPKNEKTYDAVKKTRNYINSLSKKKYFKNVTIFEADVNRGLANSVIYGVTKIINEYGKVIVVEDDLVTSINFIQYMNEALDFYSNNNKIWSISGYNVPMNLFDYTEDVYLNYRGCSWGWATWSDRWNMVDWNVSDYNKFKNNLIKRLRFNRGGNDLSQMLDAQMKGRRDSWAIRWCYQQFKENMFTIYPVKTLVKNIGLDGSGTHSGVITKLDSAINDDKVIFNNNLSINKKLIKQFKSNFDYGYKQFVVEILSLIGLIDLFYLWRRKK